MNKAGMASRCQMRASLKAVFMYKNKTSILGMREVIWKKVVSNQPAK